MDALDECNKYQELFTMLKGEYPSFPLRIFITSRNVPDIQHLSRRLEAWTSLTTIEIPVNDSMRDIECYIQSRVENLPFKTLRERAELVKAIIDRSNTCFLWVRLIMDKLETVYSSDSIMGVLRELPEGMVPYYERTIHEMAENKMEKHIAKAIILWTVASSRKLTTSELSDALKLDINAVLPSARAAIEGLCGQLVTIDKKSDTVDVVHSTAREFLLTEDAGEFTVSMTAAHERIALTCLKVLASPEMQPPRSRRAPQSEGESSPFLRYAITQFSGHLYCASSQADSLLAVLDRFFRAMVLSWIERVAREGDLHCFIRTSRDLKAYVDRCAKHRSPLNKQLKNIGDWSTDLSRLVTKFGEALLKDPTSIRCIIPPLCPISSPLYQQFGRRPDGLDIVGFKPETWDDCIASVGFGEGNPTAVSCGENLIAVSMTSGGIKLFRQQTCQKLRVLGNKWPVDLLHFTDKHIAVCTIRSLLVQDLEGNKLWEKRIRSRFIHLVSSGDSIYTMNQNGRLVVYNALNGQVDRDEGFEYRNHDVDTDHNQSTHGTPWVAPVSPDVETLAMAFRGGTVCLWDLPSSEFIGWARDDDDLLPAKMMFNPNPNVKLLLIIYTNHRISLFNTWSGSMLETWNPEVETGILSAACSNDGRTFVTTNTQGSLQIWDFESLALLYHIETPFSPQRILNFSSCGTSIVDVSASCMRIWSPAALVRRNVEEDGSIGEDAVQIHPTLGQSGPMSSTRITALCTHPSSPIVFTATFEGKVFAFDAKAGKQLAELYAHPSMECVNNLAVGRNGYIASSDSNAVMQVWKLDLGQVTNTKTPTLLLQLRMKSPVKQLCFSDSGNYLLVSTGVSDHVYSMENGELVGSWQFEPQEREIWQWIQVSDHPNQEPQLGLICDRSFERFSAPEFPKAIEGSGMVLNYKLKEGDEEKEVESFACDTVAGALILHVQHHSGFSSSSTTFLFNLGNKDQRTGTQPSLSPTYRFPNEFWKNFLGVSKKTRNFMFVDGGSWLSSLDPRHLARGKSYTRHFFVPNEYISTRYEEEKVQPVMTADDDVVFCLYGELVIMKNGLKFWDEKELDLAKHTVGVKTMATIT